MRIVILGNGGHARVLKEAVVGQIPWGFVSCTDDEEWAGEADCVVNGLGSVWDNTKRNALYDRYKGKYEFLSVVHRTAIVSSDAKLGEGCQILAGAIVCPGAIIGRNVIVNTGAQVDHDCVIADNSVLSPGVTLCGGVCVGENTFIGARATVIQSIKIRPGSRIKAMSLVKSNQ